MQEDEYYDEYEEEGEEQVEEEEYEERKPTAEEMEYLELRERIKEQIRKKMQKEHGSVLSKSQEKKKKLPSDKWVTHLFFFMHLNLFFYYHDEMHCFFHLKMIVGTTCCWPFVNAKALVNIDVHTHTWTQ